MDKLLFYQNETLEKLQNIQPKWAYGENIKNATKDFQDKINEGFKVFLLKPVELIKNVNLNDVNYEILFTGNPLNDNRISRILYRWDNNDFVDPPTICLSNEKIKPIAFYDGRHRTKLAYCFRHSQIPVAIHYDDINIISEIVQLSIN